jgi:uncharacterized membrane protein (DUF106 family)
MSMENWEKQYEKELQLIEDEMIEARRQGDEKQLKFLFREKKRIEFEYGAELAQEDDFNKNKQNQ